MDGLLEIVDTETGKCPVRWVSRGEDLYSGPYTRNVPDIIAVAHPQYVWAYHVGPYASIFTPRTIQWSEATHQPEGVLLSTGPGVETQREPLSGMGISDVAPTILYLLDLPVPSDMDGRVLAELITPDRLVSQPVRSGEPVGYWPDEHSVTFEDDRMTDEDHEQIRSRLRALGYLD